MIVADLGDPAIARHADGTHMVDVLDAQVHAAGTGGLRQTVVGVVLMRREYLLPAPDEALRNGLSADVHEAPLVELVIRGIDRALLDGEQDVPPTARAATRWCNARPIRHRRCSGA